MNMQRIIEQTRESHSEFCFRLAQVLGHRADASDDNDMPRLAEAYRQAMDLVNEAAALISMQGD